MYSFRSANYLQITVNSRVNSKTAW